MRFPPFAAFVLLLLVSCDQQPSGQCGSLIMPPEEFYHAPDAPVRVVFVPWNDVPVYCAAMSAVSKIADDQACYRIFPPAIVLPDPDGIRVTMGEVMCLEIHEWGHANGWPADHPKARHL